MLKLNQPHPQPPFELQMSEEISAKVVCDSIAPHGKRLTTFQIHVPKFLLAEINTHRMLSRNYNSSRAIPAKKMRELATFAPATFGQNKPGMTSATDLSPLKERTAQVVWASARAFALMHHKALESLGVHKQHVNRIIEPYIWCDGVISGTEWKNFFKQRMHIDAQPEMRMLACAMFDAMRESKPNLILVGDYHLPYIVNTDRAEVKKLVQTEDVFNTIKDISAARCARVSYGFDKPFNIESDINRAAMLKQGEIIHLSPFEHVATPLDSPYTSWGNFYGWRQYRYHLEQGQTQKESKT